MKPAKHEIVEACTSEARQWHDGFITYPALACFEIHKRYLRRLAPEQWDVAARLLRDGFTLGVIANPCEAVDAVAHIASRLKVSLLADYE